MRFALVTVVVLAIVVMWAMRKRSRRRPVDLGSVSSSWIQENLASRTK
jgi:hypothetical protein